MFLTTSLLVLSINPISMSDFYYIILYLPFFVYPTFLSINWINKYLRFYHNSSILPNSHFFVSSLNYLFHPNLFLPTMVIISAENPSEWTPGWWRAICIVTRRYLENISLRSFPFSISGFTAMIFHDPTRIVARRIVRCGIHTSRIQHSCWRYLVK